MSRLYADLADTTCPVGMVLFLSEPGFTVVVVLPLWDFLCTFHTLML